MEGSDDKDVQEEMRAVPFTPRPMYATSTLPAMVAKPLAMIWCISALVRTERKGLMSRTLSPWPKKGADAATTASAPDTLNVQWKKLAAFLTSH